MGNTLKKKKHQPLRKKNNSFGKKLFDNKTQNSVDIKPNQPPLKNKFFFSREKTHLTKKNLQNINKPP